MLENKAKLILYITISVLFSQCSAYKNIDKNVISFFDNYVKEKEHLIEGDIVLILGENRLEKGEKQIYVFFLNPKLMNSYQYDKIYLFRGYKTIINGKSEFLSKLLTNNTLLEYQNLNQSQYPFYYRIDMWVITLDKNNKILYISPPEEEDRIKELFK